MSEQAEKEVVKNENTSDRFLISDLCDLVATYMDKDQVREVYRAYLFGAHIAPLSSASTHVETDPLRTRKLLLHRRELDKLIGAVERRGYALIPLSMYWVRGRAKLKIGLAMGKKDYDKRATEKERDWQRDNQRLLRAH